jgi:hypothetical protein
MKHDGQTGTTGQAAHNLGRPFILIEDTVANIAAERLRRVGIQIGMRSPQNV